MKSRILHILALAIAMLITAVSCDRDVNRALDLAGDNRQEMERVLDHFKDDPDPLKYEAAKFLISNMPYHYTYKGEEMERYENAYLEIASKPIQFRDSVFTVLVDSIDFTNVTPAHDIRELKADYLIKMIDNACDVWRNSKWHREYDKLLFFNYVLPYRMLNEPVSDWHITVDEEYPYLKSKDVWSKRGVYLEAEDAGVENAKVVTTESASQGRMVLLDKPDAGVTYKINSPLPSRKNLYLRYTSTSNHGKAKVLVNNKLIESVKLDPTNTMKVFRDSRLAFTVELSKGENDITIQFDNDTIGLDYIRVANIESLDSGVTDNFSGTYYRIRNVRSGNSIVFDTLRQSLLNLIELKPVLPDDSCGMVRLDFRGLGAWSISSFKKDTLDLCLEAQYCRTDEGAPMSQYHYQNGNHQKWIFLPVGKNTYKIMSKDSGLFLESRKDDEDKERIIQTAYADKESQKWQLEPCGENIASNALFTFGSAIAEALKVYDVTNQFEWFGFQGNMPPKGSALLTGRTGNCRDEASYTVYLCRSLGIPAAIDFAPHWGNRSQGHSWSVLIKPDGKATPFYMGCAPGDTVHYYHSYLKPKVFRHSYQLNRTIAEEMRNEVSVPKLFRNADFTDVTDEYYVTTDVERDVPKAVKGHDVAYICVFDNRNWVPVYYGKIKNGKVTFKSMGRNIMYMVATFENGKIMPFGNPFLIKPDGEVRDIKVDVSSKQDMTLSRKYPFMGSQDYFNIRMAGGRFQVSNKPDFSIAKDIYRHEG
ncbi:MAG: RICIN domain-containing protein, partial [Muribaculaceae bacterium]|nr:RICIN domain-containing protein [Muribaculaceae bacterium]